MPNARRKCLNDGTLQMKGGKPIAKCVAYNQEIETPRVFCPLCNQKLQVIAAVARETPRHYNLDHGDAENYILRQALHRNVEAELPSATRIVLRLMQAVYYKEKDTVILVAHGRQPALAVTEQDGFANRSFAYMTPKGRQLLRDHYRGTLWKYVVRLQKHPSFWSTDGTPNSLVGPHTTGELESMKDAFQKAIERSDIAIITRLQVKESARDAYKADGKVPLSEVILNTELRRYSRFLLMCCRSPWDEDQLLQENRAVSGTEGVPGMLFSYNDSRNLGID